MGPMLIARYSASSFEVGRSSEGSSVKPKNQEQHRRSLRKLLNTPNQMAVQTKEEQPESEPIGSTARPDVDAEDMHHHKCRKWISSPSAEPVGRW